MGFRPVQCVNGVKAMKSEKLSLLEYVVPANDENFDQSTRSTFRIQVRGRENCFLVIDSIRYRLLDVGHAGVSIAVDAHPSMQVGNYFSSCDLILENNYFENLGASVVHMSPGCDDSWVCGVSLSNICAGSSAKIEACLKTIRKEVFSSEIAVDAWR